MTDATDSQTKQMHHQADLLLNNNRLPEARTLYDQICKLDNNDAEAYMMRGALDGEMGRVDDALHSLQESIRIDPGYADAYHTLAHILQHQGKLTEARDALQRAVELDQNFTEAWEMLGGVYGLLGEYSKAEVASRSALEQDANLDQARTNLANALVELDKVDDAIMEFKRVIQQQPGNAHAWSRLGSLQARLRQFDDATQSLETALRLNPSDLDAHGALGFIHSENHELAKAAENFQKVIEIDPDRSEAWISLIQTNKNPADTEKMLEFCDRLEARFPDNRHVTLNRGYALEKLERMEDARENYLKATVIAPNWGDAWNRLGMLHIALQEYDEAAPLLKKAIDLGVDSPLTLCMYGLTQRLEGRFDEAEKYTRLALEKSPELPPVYDHLGRTLINMGRIDEALELLHKGKELDPDNFSIIGAMAEAYERNGKYEQAYKILNPFLLRDDGEITPIVSAFAKICGKLDRREEALKMVEKALENEKLLRGGRMDLHFDAGRLYDALKQPDKAITHFNLANELKGYHYDRQAYEQRIDAMIEAFDREAMNRLKTLGNPSTQPIFILGMPRSGTSLVEQILASHPDVYGAGELMYIANTAVNLGIISTEILPDTKRLMTLDHNTVSMNAKAYLDHTSIMTTGEKYITDKMPANFMYMGIIQILFPHAHIIHTQRDPMDTCLSCYFQDFNGIHEYAYNLESLGHYYLQYERLMSHWHSVLDIPILDVKYEDIVNDTETQCRRIADFCGLEWDDRMLNFHESERVVKTASYDQVRRPVYNSSVGRWKAYEEWLEPLKKGLSALPSK